MLCLFLMLMFLFVSDKSKVDDIEPGFATCAVGFDISSVLWMMHWFN